MCNLSTKALSDLNYDLPDDVAPLVRRINRTPIVPSESVGDLVTEAQEAIDDFAATMDAELTDSGHFSRGALSEEACTAAETRLRTAVMALNAAVMTIASA